MPTADTDRSPSLARMLRRERHRRGLSLREVETRTRDEGRPIPYSTLAKIEQGRLEPGVRRLKQLLDLYEVPFELASELLDLEDLAGELPEETDPDRLLESAIEAWRQGKTREALAAFLAVRQLPRDDPETRAVQHKALLSFAIAASNLGKAKLSLKIVEELLLDDPEPSILVNILIQAASSWAELGSFEAALAFIARAEQRLSPGREKQRAWVFHERATVLKRSGRADEARKVLKQALSAYRAAEDEYGEAVARGLGVRIERSAGRWDDALLAARRTLSFTEERGYHKLATLAELEMGAALVALGKLEEGMRTLESARAKAVDQEDGESQFYCHYELWRTCKIVGDLERARFEEQAARYYARFVVGSAPEVQELRASTKGKDGSS